MDLQSNSGAPGQAAPESAHRRLGAAPMIIDLVSSAARFAALFSGYDGAFGVYNGISEERQDGKLIGKERRTAREKLTVQHYEDHLAGKSGLGVIPIQSNNTCVFGAIDIDVYAELNHGDLARRVIELELPLIVCRSKSGGAHVFCFAAEPVPASHMIAKLKEIAAIIGHGGVEVFPKQNKVLTDKGDLGSWINLPFFGGVEGNRYAVKPESADPMPLQEFLLFAESLRQERAWFDEPAITASGELPQGPPCLQHLIQLGFPPGTRNQGLFNLGVYCRKADPDRWEALLEEMNRKHMRPSLDSEEVRSIKRSLGKKSYGYRCSDQPIAAHCNRAVCQSRKHGIGQSGDTLRIESLRVLRTEPAIFFASINGKVLQVSAGDLQDARRLQGRCIESLNCCPRLPKFDEWQTHLNAVLQVAEELDAPADSSPVGVLRELLERFCNGRAKALNRDELLLSKPWTNEGRTYFRGIDFMKFLERNRFKLQPHELWACVRNFGGQQHRAWRLKGRCVDVWSVPAFEEQREAHDVPESITREEARF